MKEQDPAAGDVARLEATRARVRELVVGRQWLRRAFRQAFADFQILLDRYNAECRCLRMRELESSRALLQRGEFGDGRADRVGRVRFEGLCPARLAKQIADKDPMALSGSLRRQSAKAALAAFDRHVLRQTAETSDEQCSRIVEEEDAAIAAKTHVPFAWTVFPPHPADWKEPPDPWSMDRDELERFIDEDYRVIALHRLGGLADVGSMRPLVPRPVTTGNIQIDTPAYAAWEARLPIPHGCSGEDQPPLSPPRFPPESADQMLATVVEWVTELEDNGDEPPAVRLWRALGGLKGTLGDATAFTELSALRVERARSQEAAFNAIAGGPFNTLTDGLAAAASVSHLLDRSLPQEPSDYLHHLGDVLDEADRFCRNAITAISLGGVKKVDQCVIPGAATASFAWDVRIQRTQERLAKLRWWLWLPSTVIHEDLRGVQDDCAWLEQAITELQAAERVPKAKDDRTGDEKRFAHADDFTWIIWCGQYFPLAQGLQADTMRHLWAAWERGGRKDGCGLSEASICNLIDPNRKGSLRLSMVFRSRDDLWGKVIRPVSRGVFALFSI